MDNQLLMFTKNVLKRPDSTLLMLSEMKLGRHHRQHFNLRKVIVL